MQKETARMLARFIEAETRGEIRADALLDHDADTPAEHMARLLQKADQTATLSRWRETLHACLEAMDIARVMNDEAQLCAINERIADIYLLYTESSDVARGYYETALKHAQTPDQRCRLHCRLVRCAHTRWAIHHLLQARHFLPACREPVLPAWVDALEAEQWSTADPSAEFKSRKDRHWLCIYPKNDLYFTIP